MNKRILAIVFAGCFLFTQVAQARGSSGGFGGGSHSSGGFSSHSSGGWGSSSSGGSKSWGTSGTSSSSGRGWGSSSSSSSPKLSDADRALASKAQSNGTLFSNRSEAVNDFRSKYGSQYTSNFASQPSVRPDYIPQSTNVNGTTYNINYNSGYGSYGYMMGGRWMVYNALADAAMLSVLMPRHSYYYPPQGYASGGYSSSGPSCFTWIILLLVFVAVVWIIRKFFASRQPQVQVTTSYGSPQPISYNRAPPAKAPWMSPAKPPAKSGSDSYTPEYWQALKTGTIVTLNDELAMQESQEKLGKVGGLSYTIIETRRLRESRDMASWTMHQLKGNYAPFDTQRLWLVVKVVDREMSLGVFEQVKELSPGTRKQLVNRGDIWLFQKPKDENNFLCNDLLYTMDITRNINGSDVVYSQKPQGELHGMLSVDPPQSGVGQTMATIVEYATDVETDNTELLVLEIGDSDDGGNITIYEGGPINPAEIDVI